MNRCAQVLLKKAIAIVTLQGEASWDYVIALHVKIFHAHLASTGLCDRLNYSSFAAQDVTGHPRPHAFQRLPLHAVHISLSLDSVNTLLCKAGTRQSPGVTNKKHLCSWSCALAPLSSPHTWNKPELAAQEGAKWSERSFPAPQPRAAGQIRASK